MILVLQLIPSYRSSYDSQLNLTVSKVAWKVKSEKVQGYRKFLRTRNEKWSSVERLEFDREKRGELRPADRKIENQEKDKLII